MIEDNIEITIQMQKVDGDQYFCKGKRLSFDLPWLIYRVNHDMYIPYYRIYIGRCLMSMKLSLNECYGYLQGLSYTAAHIAEM